LSLCLLNLFVQDEVQFPAIALFQNSNWTSQATLRPNSMKCFLGWPEEDAVSCDVLPSEQLIPGQSCNCKSGWTKDVIEDFSWQNTTYRYLSWKPTPILVNHIPTYLMTLQAFFTCGLMPLPCTSFYTLGYLKRGLIVPQTIPLNLYKTPVRPSPPASGSQSMTLSSTSRTL